MTSKRYDNTDQKQWPASRLVIVGLNVIALILSLILAWHSIKGGSMAGCDGGSPCDEVLSSPWSMLAGIVPVSGMAVGVYFALLVAAFFTGASTEKPIRDMAWRVMLMLAGTIAGSAIWFTAIQKWFIGAFCPYCMATHSTGFLLAVVIIWKALREHERQSASISGEKQETENNDISRSLAKQNRNRLKLLGFPLAGLALAGFFAVSQVVFSPPPTYRTGESKENKSGIDYKSVPIIGSPDAPYIINLLFDYKCPHCQKIHFMLDEVVQRYAGKLAFALCPVPLNPHCNPYIPQEAEAFKNSCELAQIGLAVWLVNAEAFRNFETWMFTFDSGDRWRPRTLEATQAKAIELVGQAKFDDALSKPWISSYIQTCVQIYGQTLQSGKGGVPRLVFGSKWVIPEPYSTDELIAILQESLGVPKP